MTHPVTNQRTKANQKKNRTESKRITPVTLSTPADHVLLHVYQRNQDIDQILSLMGWQQLPHEVLIEILDDLQGFAAELSGGFATICPYVQNRRKRVMFWVDSVLKGICSVSTAAQALHVPSLELFEA